MEKQEEILSNFQNISVSDEDVNILLLGETGVGKSTFINSFANYLEYARFDIAEKNKVRCLIPAKFAVNDDNLEEKTVQIGNDNNENNTMYQSATLETRSYVFQISKLGIGRIRLIDTPGIGDVKGIDQDNENMENILSYISHLENLHAICFLLKPNNTRLTVMFHYCIKQLLSRLEKSASKNIIFLFTNTRGTFYKPGDTTTALKKILNDIKNNPPYTEIKFTVDNVFCLDNESFRYLVAIKNRIVLGNKESFVDSWTHSVQECWRMIDFITGNGDSPIKLTPHKVKNTISVNEARRVILQLTQPLADISDFINDNVTVLEQHNKSLQIDNQSIAQLKQNLYVPAVNLRCKELSEPTTVCAAYKCCEIIMVAGLKKYHYKQRCHDPCYLERVPREQIGSPELVNCWAMVNRKCKICKCDFSSHMHIYYISETFEDKIDNEGVKAQIKDRETALKETKKIIDKIMALKLEYTYEKDTIIKTMAKFAHFLQRNAIAPYNDAYKAYVEYLIDREKSSGEHCDYNILKHYNEQLKRYEEEKHILNEALSSRPGHNTIVTADLIFDSVQKLYMLPHTGKKIQELYSKQSQSQKKEHINTEIVLEDSQQSKQKEHINTEILLKNSQQSKQSSHNQKINRNKEKHQSSTGGISNKFNSNDHQRFNTQDAGPYNQGRYNYQRPSYNYQQGPAPQWMYENFQNYQYRKPHNFNNNFPPNQGNFANYSGQYGNFPGPPQYPQGFGPYPGQEFNNSMNRPTTNNSSAGASDRDFDFEEWYKHSQAEAERNDFSKTKGARDFDFEERYKHNQAEAERNYFSKTKGAFKYARKGPSSDSSQSDSEDNNIYDDDESFKDFMKTNNLEYLMKAKAKNSSGNNNQKSEKKPNKNGKTHSHGVSQEDLEEHQNRNKNRSLFSKFF